MKEDQYIKPTLIKFKESKTVKLKELKSFLNKYKPFPCADVYAYERFQYGDFDNYVEAISASRTINLSYTNFFETIGKYNFSIQDCFWDFNKDKAFWNEAPEIGFSDYQGTSLFDIEVQLDGVYIISWSDKEDIEKGISKDIDIIEE